MQMLRTLHGLIHGRFPQGSLYLFPDRGTVLDFSRGRFSPLIRDNPQLALHVQDTDAVNIKRVGSSILYLRGARSTSNIGGLKRSSAQLKSVPVDQGVFDEADEMESRMIDLALERMSHSTVKEQVFLSTPAIPGYGVDAMFEISDKRHWFLSCEGCGHETCLELEFPDGLHEQPDGSVIRVCRRCGSEIFPTNGNWRALHPSRSADLVGWRISQLCSLFVDPAEILRMYRNPPNGNLAEVMNSKLAAAYIAAENRLSREQVLALCVPSTPILQEDRTPSCMGVDVGGKLHVVIGRRRTDGKKMITHIGEYLHFADVADLARRFNVSCCVIDGMPETRAARDFASTSVGKVFLCFYSDSQKSNFLWSTKDNTVKVGRTESLDQSHTAITSGEVVLPAESETLHEFARHCANVARVIHKEPDTGLSKYLYIQTGPDHYRHSWNYLNLALCQAGQSFFKNYPKY